MENILHSADLDEILRAEDAAAAEDFELELKAARLVAAFWNSPAGAAPALAGGRADYFARHPEADPAARLAAELEAAPMVCVFDPEFDENNPDHIPF